MVKRSCLSLLLEPDLEDVLRRWDDVECRKGKEEEEEETERRSEGDKART